MIARIDAGDRPAGRKQDGKGEVPEVGCKRPRASQRGLGDVLSRLPSPHNTSAKEKARGANPRSRRNQEDIAGSEREEDRVADPVGRLAGAAGVGNPRYNLE